MNREINNPKDIKDLLDDATYVSNDIDLKTAIGKKELIIISTDLELYSRLLKKLPKENIASGSKKLGKVLIGIGTFISIASCGLFSFIGIPMAGVGAALEITGIALDDCKDYSLSLDYDNKRVVFLKVKGTPRIEQKGKRFKKIYK